MKPMHPSALPEQAKLLDQTSDRAFWKVRHGSRSIWIIAHMDGVIDREAPLVGGFQGNYQKARDGKAAWALVKAGKTAAMSPVTEVMSRPSKYIPRPTNFPFQLLGDQLHFWDETNRTVQV